MADRSGRRGSGGQATAAAIWGLSTNEYLRRADPWPLNPDGELLLGLKIENTRALANAEEVTAVPGIAFAEWGPGDMGMSLGLPDAHDPPYPPEMAAARNKVLAACKANKLAFLEQVTPENVVDQIAAASWSAPASTPRKPPGSADGTPTAQSPGNQRSATAAERLSGALCDSDSATGLPSRRYSARAAGGSGVRASVRSDWT